MHMISIREFAANAGTDTVHVRDYLRVIPGASTSCSCHRSLALPFPSDMQLPRAGLVAQVGAVVSYCTDASETSLPVFPARA